MKINIGPYKDKRKISIKLDKYDTWNMDNTLSLIILPMLKQLKETKHGSSFVDNIDAPEHLKAPPKENDRDTDEFFHARWDWVMDEMIWAFETHAKDDYMCYEENEERLVNGLRLFGKYFRDLWD
jgi:hypothetical protein